MKRYHFLQGLAVYWRGQEIMAATKTKKIKKKFTPFAYKRTIAEALARTFDQFADAGTIALSVGLTQEKLKNHLRNHFDTSGIITLARTRPRDLVVWLEVEFDLIRSLNVQRHKSYEFGDILVARAGTP